MNIQGYMVSLRIDLRAQVLLIRLRLLNESLHSRTDENRYLNGHAEFRVVGLEPLEVFLVVVELRKQRILRDQIRARQPLRFVAFDLQSLGQIVRIETLQRLTRLDGLLQRFVLRLRDLRRWAVFVNRLHHIARAVAENGSQAVAGVIEIVLKRDQTLPRAQQINVGLLRGHGKFAAFFDPRLRCLQNLIEALYLLLRRLRQPSGSVQADVQRRDLECDVVALLAGGEARSSRGFPGLSYGPGLRTVQKEFRCFRLKDGRSRAFNTQWKPVRIGCA